LDVLSGLPEVFQERRKVFLVPETTTCGGWPVFDTMSNLPNPAGLSGGSFSDFQVG
jgi:hypothetical protein